MSDKLWFIFYCLGYLILPLAVYRTYKWYRISRMRGSGMGAALGQFGANIFFYFSCVMTLVISGVYVAAINALLR